MSPEQEKKFWKLVFIKDDTSHPSRWRIKLHVLDTFYNTVYLTQSHLELPKKYKFRLDLTIGKIPYFKTSLNILHGSQNLSGQVYESSQSSIQRNKQKPETNKKVLSKGETSVYSLACWKEACSFTQLCKGCSSMSRKQKSSVDLPSGLSANLCPT